MFQGPFLYHSSFSILHTVDKAEADMAGQSEKSSDDFTPTKDTEITQNQETDSQAGKDEVMDRAIKYLKTGK